LIKQDPALRFFVKIDDSIPDTDLVEEMDAVLAEVAACIPQQEKIKTTIGEMLARNVPCQRLNLQ
jgi:hypothetical protein